ncbi:class II aldolase/adducin family protein [Brevibacillus fluminis]|uniref:Class II aldolase/adducin family protein n=1 Tax=Brevibacillus fluminis TaxID=511487 RepID=A0A3M8DTP1_9BACL|nr:class II aldolase/adducin family protein [Brevibacillus fluminis]RNB90347.1 class II aldolase/adducin family protein [Brevibacillus fluminis]
MLLQEMRTDVLRYAQRMYKAGLTVGVSGNVSAIDRESNTIAITPSGMDYDELTPEDITLIDLEGQVVDGTRRPSSEKMLHIKIYQSRPDVNAVFHTHSTYATALAAMGEPIPVILAEVAAIAGGPIPVAPYARFGTPEFGDVAVAAMGDKPAALLQNHGVVCAGKDLQKAFLIAVDTEEAAKIYMFSLMAGKRAIRLNDEEIPVLHEIYATRYGQNPLKP